METLGLEDGCNTHPHHIYLQFLSEIGIIGFFIFFSIFVYITYNLFILLKNLLKELLIKNIKQVISFCLLYLFLCFRFYLQVIILIIGIFL